jgi:hypothetical protein
MSAKRGPGPAETNVAPKQELLRITVRRLLMAVDTPTTGRTWLVCHEEDRRHRPPPQPHVGEPPALRRGERSSALWRWPRGIEREDASTVLGLL